MKMTKRSVLHEVSKFRVSALLYISGLDWMDNLRDVVSFLLCLLRGRSLLSMLGNLSNNDGDGNV